MSEMQYVSIWFAGMGAIILLLGIIFTLIAFTSAKNRKRRLMEWIPVPAVLIGFTTTNLYNPKHGQVGTTLRNDDVFGRHQTEITKLPVFDYIINGQTFRSAPRAGYTQKPPFWIGDTVEILYDPNDIRNICVKDDITHLKVMRVFKFVGIILLIIAAIALSTSVIFLLSA